MCSGVNVMRVVLFSNKLGIYSHYIHCKSAGDMALSGVKVVEMAGLAPAPFCGKILRDFGASVVKVDRVSQAEHMDCLSDGKRSIAVDLKQAAAVDIVRRLCRQSDVLIEPFRPGVMERLGLGPQLLTADNPHLVYARLTGYGQTGPLAARAGHDINYLAVSGVLWALKQPGRPPVPPVNLLADFAGGGLTCAMGIMAALLERSRSGHGQVIDCSMTEGAAYVSSWLFKSRGMPFLWGNEPGQNILDGGAYFYGCYETADGRYMAVGCLEPAFYRRFVDLLEVPCADDLSLDEAEASRRAVATAFKRHSRRHWTSVFRDVDACVTPVLTLREAATQILEDDGDDDDEPPPPLSSSSKRSTTRATLKTTQLPTDTDYIVLPAPAAAPRLSRTPAYCADGGDSRQVVVSGQHTAEVLHELGFTHNEVHELVTDGAVWQAEPVSSL